MRNIALLLILAAAVAAGTAGAAQAPVARAAGLAVEHRGVIYVAGRQVVRGSQPAWSRDGKRLAYTRAGRLYVADANGRNERLLGGTNVSSPAWSPDGRTIAYTGDGNIHIVPSSGGKAVDLTRSREHWRLNATPAFSPDGRTIAFTRSTDAFNSDIFLMSSSGKGLRRLTRTQGSHDEQGEESSPSWSPDGKRIVFLSNRDGNFELYSIGRDGRGERRLTKTPRRDEESPRFSRDGKRLLFVYAGRVATSHADGGGVRVLGLGTSADWR